MVKKTKKYAIGGAAYQGFANRFPGVAAKMDAMRQAPVQGVNVAPPPQISDAVSRDIKMRLEPNGPTAQAQKANMSGVRPFRGFKKGGAVKSSASKRADGIATKGKTRGKII